MGRLCCVMTEKVVLSLLTPGLEEVLPSPVQQFIFGESGGFQRADPERVKLQIHLKCCLDP